MDDFLEDLLSDTLDTDLVDTDTFLKDLIAHADPPTNESDTDIDHTEDVDNCQPVIVCDSQDSADHMAFVDQYIKGTTVPVMKKIENRGGAHHIPTDQRVEVLIDRIRHDLGGNCDTTNYACKFGKKCLKKLNHLNDDFEETVKACRLQRLGKSDLEWRQQLRELILNAGDEQVFVVRGQQVCCNALIWFWGFSKYLYGRMRRAIQRGEKLGEGRKIKPKLTEGSVLSL